MIFRIRSRNAEACSTKWFETSREADDLHEAFCRHIWEFLHADIQTTSFPNPAEAAFQRAMAFHAILANRMDPRWEEEMVPVYPKPGFRLALPSNDDDCTDHEIVVL